ncbi:MAG: glycosyltransferase family 4 protein [Candidatus Omnitrophota bacterium]
MRIQESFCLNKKGGSGVSKKIFTIITPANLLPIKGHCYMIEACGILKHKSLRIRYLIAGTGPLESELKTIVTKYGLLDCIEFKGCLPHEQIIDMYQKGDIDSVVLPSVVLRAGEHEGIPVALMEAMANGIPVISTKTGSISELVGYNEGILVNPSSAEELANAIETLINDTVYYNKLSISGRDKIIRDFNSEKICAELMQVYQN